MERIFAGSAILIQPLTDPTHFRIYDRRPSAEYGRRISRSPSISPLFLLRYVIQSQRLLLRNGILPLRTGTSVHHASKALDDTRITSTGLEFEACPMMSGEWLRIEGVS